VRTFEVNLATGAANATKLEKGEMKRWSDTLDVEARDHVLPGSASPWPPRRCASGGEGRDG